MKKIKSWLKSAWYFTVLAVTTVFFAVFGGLHLYALIAWNRLTGARESVRVRRISGWQMVWSGFFLGVVFFLMRVRVEYRTKKPVGKPNPAIVIGNHRHDIDALLFSVIMRRLGYRSFSGVAKRELRSVPIIGRAFRETGFAMVARNRDRRDLERVRRCAESVLRNGASLLIFPEGTTFFDSNRRGDLRHLLLPKSGGLKVIRETLPNYPVLSVTVHWGKDPVLSTIPAGTDLIGRRLIVYAEMKEIGEGEGIESWLKREWRRKDVIMEVLKVSK
ncbi:1-acyl-sn-glycerol-3-phosphate acyltransferase [Candidatus Uhrbacteria bacterium]|nr:1-acyl-sn-glycerol-3-phosphate acyltransferase [Candidatus Uhrbacteria bacterium]